MNRRLSLVFLGLFLASSPRADSRTILVIESYNPEYLWDASYKEGLQETLGKDYQLVFYAMDTKRRPRSEHQKMADGGWSKYLEVKPVLTILGDDAALKYLGPKFASEKIPVVFLGINGNPRSYFRSLPENMTGILERPILKRSLAYIKELVPTVKNVLVLFDTDLTSTSVKEESFGGHDREKISGIDVDVKLIGSLDDWRATVTSSKGKYDAIITGLYHTIKDAAGKPVDPEEVIRWTSANAPVPPFAFWDFSVGPDKAIGGLVLYGKDMGLLAGEMAKKVLSGTPPSKIAYVHDTQGVFLFSKKQLDKWKIVLPAGLKSARLTE